MTLSSGKQLADDTSQVAQVHQTIPMALIFTNTSIPLLRNKDFFDAHRAYLHIENNLLVLEQIE